MGIRIRNPRNMVVNETAESRAYGEVVTKALHANLSQMREQTRGSMGQIALLLGLHLREKTAEAEKGSIEPDTSEPPAHG